MRFISLYEFSNKSQFWPRTTGFKRRAEVVSEHRAHLVRLRTKAPEQLHLLQCKIT